MSMCGWVMRNGATCRALSPARPSRRVRQSLASAGARSSDSAFRQLPPSSPRIGIGASDHAAHRGQISELSSLLCGKSDRSRTCCNRNTSAATATEPWSLATRPLRARHLLRPHQPDRSPGADTLGQSTAKARSEARRQRRVARDRRDRPGRAARPARPRPRWSATGGCRAKAGSPRTRPDDGRDQGRSLAAPVTRRGERND
jgi:hypothetical protein